MPFPHFIQASIYFRVLNPCVYLGPGVYMSPAFIEIITVYVYSQTNSNLVGQMYCTFSMEESLTVVLLFLINDQTILILILSSEYIY